MTDLAYWSILLYVFSTQVGILHRLYRGVQITLYNLKELKCLNKIIQVSNTICSFSYFAMHSKCIVNVGDYNSLHFRIARGNLLWSSAAFVQYVPTTPTFKCQIYCILQLKEACHETYGKQELGGIVAFDSIKIRDFEFPLTFIVACLFQKC